MFVNIQKAIELTGVSRSTIQRHIKAGKLTKTDKGIDTAELIRVYGELKPVNESVKVKQSNEAPLNHDWLMAQIEQLQNELKQVKNEAMERERQALEREKQAHEREQRLMLLLANFSENKSSSDNSTGGFFSGLFKR